MSGKQSEVTRLLDEARSGSSQAVNQLFPLVYDELKRISSANLRNEFQNKTMFTTDLVHEAFLKLVGDPKLHWENRLHFYSIAANSMRQILVDHARARKAVKRGGALTRVTFDEALAMTEQKIEHAAALDEALQQLEKVDKRSAQIVELRFFTGLTIEEIAEMLSISARTVKRDWEFAKAWLNREMNA